MAQAPRRAHRVNVFREARAERAVFTALLALAGCEKAAGPATSGPPSKPPITSAAREAPAADASAAAQRKLNAYVDAYNSLHGGQGLNATRRDYVELDIPHAKPSAKLYFSKGGLDYVSKNLRAARALPGTGPQGLDTLADALVPRLGALDRELAELAGYYDARSYEDDKLARGRARRPAVETLFIAAHDAAVPFEDAVKAALVERSAAHLAELKTSGDTLAYRSALAMSQAQALVESFKGASGLKSAGLYAAADAAARALDETLADQRRALAEAKAAMKGVDSNSPLVQHEALAGNLGEMLGSYRALRTSHDAYDHKEMVDKFNRAVDASNRMVAR